MNKNLPFLLLLLLSFVGSTLIGQSNVSLKINHKLGDVDFAFGTEATNNMSNQFNADRLEYYLSGFTLIHDGTSTELPSMHFLVKANEETVLNLGNFDVTDITEIRFHVGVDASVNHDDPSLLPSDNPLSPQFPSMHWGWAAGYRFIAMEGKGGANLNQQYELHGLGDDNYFETRQSVTPTTTTDNIVIELDGNYTKIIENVNVSGGVISHGETGAAKKALENMRDFVFSQAGSISDVTDYNAVNKFEIFPNPSSTGLVQITVETTNNEAVDLQVFRADGSLVATQILRDNDNTNLQLGAKGFYFLRISQNGKTVGYQKIAVQ